MSKISTVTINNIDYGVSFTFVEKQKQASPLELDLPWSCIEEFEYIDDVMHVGLFGTITIIDSGNVLSTTVFQNIERFLLKVILVNVNEDLNLTKNDKAKNKAEGFENYGYATQMYFNIVKVDNIFNKNTSSSTKYKCTLIESFLGEGSIKNFLSYKNNEVLNLVKEEEEQEENSSSDNNEENSKEQAREYEVLFAIPTLVNQIREYIINTPNQYDVDTQDYDFNSNLLEMTIDYNNIMNIDDTSMFRFEKDYEVLSGKIGRAIVENAQTTDSCTDILDTINKNFFAKPFETEAPNLPLVYDFCTMRMENIFNMVGYPEYDDQITKKYNSMELNGKRRIVYKSGKDLFSQCFGEANRVYELFVDPRLVKKKSDLDKFPKTSFYSPANFSNVNLIPVNQILTAQEWCDTLVACVDDSSENITKTYHLKEIMNCYNQYYLNNKKDYVVPINFSENHKFKGVARKDPLFFDDELQGYITGKLLRNIILLNSIHKVTIPGNIIRKANEMVYVMSNLIGLSNKNNSVYGNLLRNNYYYVSCVVHNFRGSVYTNYINLSTVCIKNIKTESDTDNSKNKKAQDVDEQSSNTDDSSSETPIEGNDLEPIDESLLEQEGATPETQTSAGERTPNADEWQPSVNNGEMPDDGLPNAYGEF